MLVLSVVQSFSNNLQVPHCKDFMWETSVFQILTLTLQINFLLLLFCFSMVSAHFQTLPWHGGFLPHYSCVDIIIHFCKILLKDTKKKKLYNFFLFIYFFIFNFFFFFNSNFLKRKRKTFWPENSQYIGIIIIMQ